MRIVVVFQEPVDKECQFFEVGVGGENNSLFSVNNSDNIIIVYDVEIGAFVDGTEIVIEPAGEPGVPIADEEWDADCTDAEKDEEDKLPLDELEAFDLFEDALAFDFVWFVGDLVWVGSLRGVLHILF